MDDNEEINNDDSLECFSDTPRPQPFPDSCRNEAQGIEILSAYFMERHNACPLFFAGSLRDACRAAFDSLHGPIVVYIHHEKVLPCQTFCFNVLCSEPVIDYLLNNYLVWPWDITYPSNQKILIEMWKDVFPCEAVPDFSMENCPMLIGVIKRSEYQLVPLLKSNTLVRTEEQSSRQAVLTELSMFREEFDALSSELLSHSGFDVKTIVEICRYLSLNDAIKAFSIDVLVYLRQMKAKVHITEPCEVLFETITRRIKSEQILSLCLNTDESCLQMIVDFLPKFNQITSLTLINLQVLEDVSEYGVYFPKLTRLSLRYNNEIGFNVMRNILCYLPESVRIFEIHCTSVLCTHYEPEKSFQDFRASHQVKGFLLDLDRYPLITSEDCFQQHKACFLSTTIDLLKCMRRLQCVHLIINQYDLESLLDMKEWKKLCNYCYYLTKVKLQILGNISQDEGLSQKILDIQNEWRHLRRDFEFQVISS